jgi:cell division transport system permease protein
LKLQQGFYLVRESFQTLGRHKGIMSLSVIIMSLTLLVLAVFLLATDNMVKVLDHARQDLKVYVYIDDTATQSSIEELHRAILSMGSVESILFISKSEALDELRKELGDDDFILETLESNPLPASFRVTLKSDQKSLEQTETFAKQIAAMEGVEQVDYGRDFLERFSLMTRLFMSIDVVLGIIVILSAVFIIANTVRLTILTRRKTIEILKLVGATNRFITTPFVFEGAFQGGLASIVSLGLLMLIFIPVRRMVPGMTFLPVDKIVLYVATCVVLGSVGSYAALRRFLKL